MAEMGSQSYRRYLQGDDQGMVELVREYKDGLMLYLNSLVGDLHVAEDLAEDTFVKLAVKKPPDRGGASFRTWLYAMGRHRAIDWMRRNRHRRELSLEELQELAADGESLEESYLREEQKIAVHRAMGKLKEDYRQILWLVYFEGFAVKDAAWVMGKSAHGGETLIYRARRALKEILEQEGIHDVEER